MSVGQVLTDYPETRRVLALYVGLPDRHLFGDPEPLSQLARRHGVSPSRLLAELAGSGVQVDFTGLPAYHAYRPFVAAALAITLSLGSGWGALLLFQIGIAGDFNAVPVRHVVAHGEAQLWGFVALFIMGIASRWLPMAMAQPVPVPRWSHWLLAAMLFGIAGGFIWSLAPQRWPWLGPASGASLLAAAALFVRFVAAQVSHKLRFSWVRHVVAGAIWMVLWAALLLLLRSSHMRAGPGSYSFEARWLLIELPVFGLALNCVYGFGRRMIPGLLGAPLRRGLLEATFGIHNVGVGILFVGHGGLASVPIWLGPILIALAAMLYVGGLGVADRSRRLLARPEQGHRLLPRYVQVAFVWLLVGLGLLSIGPLYEWWSDQSLPHAWSGAARHALTVGFLMTLIFGMAQRLLPILGHTLLAWPAFVGPILTLIATGCFVRVSSELATLYWPTAFVVMPISVVLELTAIVLFAANMLRTLWPTPDPLVRTGWATARTPAGLLLAEHPWLKEELIASGVRYLERVRSVPTELTLGSMLASEGLKPSETIARINMLLSQRSPEVTIYSGPKTILHQNKGAPPMQATDVLIHEHRVIEQVLSCLEKIADQAASGDSIDWAAAEQAVEFFRGFADQCHHAKEEKHLFPALEERGLSRQFGPTGVMLEEHQQGREHISQMAASIEAGLCGEPGAAGCFTYHARAYIRLLREHIGKEDHCLFPMADAVLSERDQASLAAQFEHMESEEMPATAHEDYIQIANELAERFGVPQAPAGPNPPCRLHQRASTSQTGE